MSTTNIKFTAISSLLISKPLKKKLISQCNKEIRDSKLNIYQFTISIKTIKKITKL